MKFALFEFDSADCGNEGNGLYVGESSWIVDLDEEYANNKDFDFSEEVVVNWPGKNGAQTFQAKVHRFSDEKRELNELMQSFLQEESECDVSLRGRKRKLKRQESDWDDLVQEKETVKSALKKRQTSKAKAQKESMKKSQLGLLKKLDKQLKDPTLETSAIISPSVTLNLDDTAKEKSETSFLAEQNIKLRKENSWLKNQVLTSLKVFPSLVDKLTGAMSSDSASSCWSGTPATPELFKSSQSSGLSSVTSTPPAPSSIKSSTQLVISKDEDKLTVLTCELVSSCVSTDARKMTNNLLKAVFGMQHLSNHSLSGTPNKPALDGQKIASIINAVIKQFQHETERNIRHYVTDYLNNAAKSSRCALLSKIPTD